MYRTIETGIWDDPKFKKLDKDGKLLFLYLFSNRHTHLSGLYYLPLVVIAHETGLNVKTVKLGLKVLEDEKMVLYDDLSSLVWVVNMLRYQTTGPKAHRSVEKQLQSLHSSPLIEDFKAYYPDFKNIPSIHSRYRIDRVSIPHRHQEQEQEQEQEQDISPSSKTRGRDPAFDFFARTFDEIHDSPYGNGNRGDFVALAKLRKTLGLSGKLSPPHWESACRNYLVTPMASHTIRDLARPERFAIFKSSQLDRYGKPITKENPSFTDHPDSAEYEPGSKFPVVFDGKRKPILWIGIQPDGSRLKIGPFHVYDQSKGWIEI